MNGWTVCRKGTAMERVLLVALALGLLVASVQRARAVEPNAEQTKAVAAIEKLGGGVATIHQEKSGQPRVVVWLARTKVTDAGLVHLKALPPFDVLILSDAKVTDEGLKRLRQVLPNCEISR
jgi:hypothetical protein